ncbi:MAG: hypothetical protein JOY68_05705, partial [Candidatus Dormibacteraeota bacterium]|nr:hypothetical protein [Candidatus Dormibacteraeota bacterium]
MTFSGLDTLAAMPDMLTDAGAARADDDLPRGGALLAQTLAGHGVRTL